MNFEEQIVLVLLGGVIALASGLVGAFINHKLSLRRFEEERKLQEKLHQEQLQLYKEREAKKLSQEEQQELKTLLLRSGDPEKLLSLKNSLVSGRITTALGAVAILSSIIAILPPIEDADIEKLAQAEELVSHVDRNTLLKLVDETLEEMNEK